MEMSFTIVYAGMMGIVISTLSFCLLYSSLPSYKSKIGKRLNLLYRIEHESLQIPSDIPGEFKIAVKDIKSCRKEPPDSY